MHKTFKLAALATAFFGASLAHATTYDAVDIVNGNTPGAVFSATGGDLVLKTYYDVNGVGVSDGYSGTEIDAGETVDVAFTSPVKVSSFQLTYLYDGPEFGDVQEKAQVTATFADLTKVSYSLTALFPNTYAWTGLGTVVNPNPNIDVNGGMWTVNNPFGDAEIKSLSFTPLEGVCAASLTCNNPSDFTVSNVITAPVPEPSTYAMMLLGLGGLSLVARRRKPG